MARRTKPANRSRSRLGQALAIAVLGKGGRRSVFSHVRAALGKDLSALAPKVMRLAYSPNTPPDKLYDRIRSVLPALEREKSLILSKISQDQKLENLAAVLSDGVFYYCTEHPNAADDHSAYQGKLYVSRHWKERCRDEAERSRVGEYVSRYGLKEAEWVIGSPVYLVTRRNCTHRLLRVGTEDVLKGQLPSPTPTVLSLSENWYTRKLRNRYLELSELARAFPELEKFSEDLDRARSLYEKRVGK